MGWTPFEEVNPVRNLDVPPGLEPGQVFANNKYLVIRRQMPSGIWLSIKTHSNDASHDWRDFQRIKNELAGPECEAVELYPAESRLVDTSNQYHLWCLPAGEMFPFGFNERLVSEAEMCNTRQRKWKEGRPTDLLSEEELRTRLAQQ